MKIRTKTVAALSAICIATSVMVGAYLDHAIYQNRLSTLQATIDSRLSDTVFNYDQIDQKLRSDLLVMSQDRLMIAFFENEQAEQYDENFEYLNQYLEKFRLISPGYFLVSAYNADAELILHSAENYYFPGTTDSRLTQLSPQMASNVVLSENIEGSGIQVLSRFMPIFSTRQSDSIVGWVKISFRLDTLLEQASGSPYQLAIYDGRWLTGTHDNRTFEALNLTPSGYPLNEMLTYSEDLTWQYTKLQHGNFLVLLFDHTQWQMEGQIATQRTLIAMLTLFLALGIVVFVVLQRIVLKPIDDFHRHIDAQDLHRIEPYLAANKRNDELGKLGRAFNRLVARQQSSQDRLIRLANTDELTGLPNRSALYKQLSEQAQKTSTFSVLFIDLDGFKKVNDVLGHGVGDQLLYQVARRLEALVRRNEQGTPRPQDTVLRLGGDEFTVVAYHSDSRNAHAESSQLAQRIIHAIQHEFLIDDQPIFIGASIGIAMFPEHTRDLSLLIQYADMAMYEAKRLGKMRFEHFSLVLAKAEEQKLALENEVRSACELHKIEAFLQPIVRLRDNRIVGFEALARIAKTEGGYLSPVHFIPIADRLGLLNRITLSMVEQACDALEACADSTLKAAINISPWQLTDLPLLSEIRYLLWMHDIDPSRIEFEVTEDKIIENELEAEKALRQMQKFGFTTALDDFGVGYSALAHLKRFKFNTLKLDKLFIDDINSIELSSQAIVAPIIAMARNLKMNIVAEGVENTEQYQKLRTLGVDLAQGFLLERPISAQEFIERFARSPYIERSLH